jgi:D-glycero-D-manno-heptose 1,7-bisphosphate phosphatase
MRKTRAIFLDRDGVLNIEVSYITDPEQIVLVEGAARAVSMLNAAGWLVVVITNQSGIARGFLDEARLEQIHARLLDLLQKENARIDRIYFSPFHPEAAVEAYRRESDCRKPGPGMILRAAEELGIALEESILIGDSLTDIEAGLNAGLRASYLLQSGHGKREIARLASDEKKLLSRPTDIFPDLETAAAFITGKASARE